MTIRIHIDWTRCDGHGACAELLPDYLGIDDFGFPVPLTRERDIAIADRDLVAARHAVRNCPLMALTEYHTD